MKFICGPRRARRCLSWPSIGAGWASPLCTCLTRGGKFKTSLHGLILMACYWMPFSPRPVALYNEKKALPGQVLSLLWALYTHTCHWNSRRAEVSNHKKRKPHLRAELHHLGSCSSYWVLGNSLLWGFLAVGSSLLSAVVTQMATDVSESCSSSTVPGQAL